MLWIQNTLNLDPVLHFGPIWIQIRFQGHVINFKNMWKLFKGKIIYIKKSFFLHESQPQTWSELSSSKSKLDPYPQYWSFPCTVHKNVVFFFRGFNLKKKFPPSLRVTSTEKNCFPLPPPLSPPGWRLLPQGEISLLRGNIYDRALFAEVGTIELRVDICW